MLCTSVNHRVMLPGWPPRSLVYVGLGFCREVHLKPWTVESGVPTMVSCLFLGMDGKWSSTRTANHLEVHLSEFCSSCCIHWTVLSWACVFESTVLVGNNISQASPRAFEYRSWNVKIPFWWKKSISKFTPLIYTLLLVPSTPSIWFYSLTISTTKKKKKQWALIDQVNHDDILSELGRLQKILKWIEEIIK